MTTKTAKALIIDQIGTVGSLKDITSAPLGLAACVDALGVDALSKKALKLLASEIQRVRVQSLMDMTEEEKTEMEMLCAAGVTEDPRRMAWA